MKKQIFYVIAVVIIGGLASCAPRYIVRERPPEVIYSRPEAPSRDHIWVTGDWVWEAEDMLGVKDTMRGVVKEPVGKKATGNKPGRDGDGTGDIGARNKLKYMRRLHSPLYVRFF